MLNRTNRTISATSTRLNLGTRSLALVANGNIGNETLRHAHTALPVAVRAGVVRYPVPIGFAIPIMEPKPMKSDMHKTSGSSPMPLWPTLGRQAWAQVSLVADASTVVRPVDDSVVKPLRRGVAPLAPSVQQDASSQLAACLATRACLAGRLARAAMVSDAAP